MSQRKDTTTRRSFLKTAVTATAATTQPDRYTAAAERLAVLLESADTPEPLRGMLAELVAAYIFNFMETDDLPEVTPAYVRRELPRLLAEAVREGFIYSDITTTAIAFKRGRL